MSSTASAFDRCCDSALENLENQIQKMRAEQLEANKELQAKLQILIEKTEKTESAKAEQGERGEQGGWVTERCPPNGHCPRAQTKRIASAQSNLSKQSRHSTIPQILDLEKMLLKESAIPPSNTSTRPSRVQPLPVQPDLDSVHPQPPRSKAPSLSVDPPISRGSALQTLTKDSDARILKPAGEGKNCSEVVCSWRIFQENIGVRLWLNWSNFTSLLILLLYLIYLVPTIILQFWRQQPGEHLGASALFIYSIVAVLFLQLVKRSLRSQDLNVAMQQLDEFLGNCGHGLDWQSVSKQCWRRFLALWFLVVLAFVVQQTFEVWMMIEDFGLHELLGSCAPLHFAKASASTLLFAVTSAVVMNAAYFQLTLLLGLGKTLDCWCADLMEDQDFIAGINSWNSLQALLKSVAREVTACFTAFHLFGYAGFFAAMVGSFSLLIDPNLDGPHVTLYEFAMLPLIYLFYLSARLLIGGAQLSEKCHQIPAFVNQLACAGPQEPCTHRQYLVRYISDSRAGFSVCGVTLSQGALLKQAHLFFALCSGLAGILMRRFL